MIRGRLVVEFSSLDSFEELILFCEERGISLSFDFVNKVKDSRMRVSKDLLVDSVLGVLSSNSDSWLSVKDVVVKIHNKRGFSDKTFYRCLQRLVLSGSVVVKRVNNVNGGFVNKYKIKNGNVF